MTVSDITKLYERIINQILLFNLKEAFSGLGYLMQQNGFGRAYDQLVELENNYRYMLRYRLEGYPDPDREKMNSDLRRHLIQLADDAYHLWLTKNSTDIYYDRIRMEKMSDSESLSQLVSNVRQSGEKMTMVELVEDSQSRELQVAQIAHYRENITSRIFTKIWLSGNWKDTDRLFLMDVFNDPAFFNHEKALFVSAILLSLQKRMDAEKLSILMELCTHEQMEISQRALVAMVLSLYVQDDRITLYTEIAPRLASIMDNPLLQESLVRVFYQLIRSKDTENITKRMQEEILPEITKFGSEIQDKIRNGEGEDLSEEFNPDWKNRIENAGLSVKMQEFSEMQLEGVDVYMSTFSSQKSYPFFQDFSNWFLPFYPSHSNLSELFENNPLEGASILDTVLKSDYLCSSDKYSFCFNILQIPSSYRSSMANQFGADSEAYEEINKAQMGLTTQFKQEQTSNRYIQDLYRFFHLFNRKKDFKNIFSLPLDLHNTKSLSVYLQSEQALKRIGYLYFKNKNFTQALAVFDLLITNKNFEAEIHQKRGFCLQQIQDKAGALDAYLQADLIQPDSIWTLKRIAACYRQLKSPIKALEYYRRAELLEPGQIPLTMNIGHCLVEAGDYKEALKSYFKAEVLSDESPKTWRPIAWCSFMCKKYDQAGKYYEKILQFNPTIEDFLNAGHLEWCKGLPKNAIEVYKRGIRLTHTILPDFMEMFQKDVNELINHGINPDDISPVRDELMYELEE